MSPDAYPLQWPVGRKRWPSYRQRNTTFKMADNAKVKHLLDELDRLDAKDVVISTNRAPYSRASKMDDPGVAVYFKRKGQELCVACDKWDKIEDNIHSIGLAVQAMRGMERWGTSDMVDAAFSGFTALPPGGDPNSAIYVQPRRNWWDVLEVQQTSSKELIRSAYKVKALKVHPDKEGGDAKAFEELTWAYEEGMK